MEDRPTAYDGSVATQLIISFLSCFMCLTLLWARSHSRVHGLEKSYCKATFFFASFIYANYVSQSASCINLYLINFYHAMHETLEHKNHINFSRGSKFFHGLYILKIAVQLMPWANSRPTWWYQLPSNYHDFYIAYWCASFTQMCIYKHTQENGMMRN